MCESTNKNEGYSAKEWFMNSTKSVDLPLLGNTERIKYCSIAQNLQLINAVIQMCLPSTEFPWTIAFLIHHTAAFFVEPLL